MNKKLVSILAAIMAGVLLVSLMLSLLSSVFANAASSSEILNQIQQLESEKAVVDAELNKWEALLSNHLKDMQAMIDQKDAIDHQIALYNDQINTVTQLVSAYNLLIADRQEDLDQAEARLEALNQKYKARIRAMEEQGSLSYWSVIFNASSFADLLDRLTMVAEIAAADANRLKQLKEAAQEVEAARADLLEKKQEMEATKRYLQNAQEEMAAKRAEADKLLADLVAIGDEYNAYIENAEALQDQLMHELAQKENEYDQQKYKEWLSTSVPPTTTSAATSVGSGLTGNTVSGVTWYTPTKNFFISSPFGNRVHPITGVYTMHNGIDMAANTGTPVYATRSGIVTVAAYQAGGAGYYVKIDHCDGSGSIYMHMTHSIVAAGDCVSAGQIIGYVGSTGGSTGPHLHFGISYKGVYVDPLKYIKV